MPLADCGGVLRNIMNQCSVVDLSADDARMVEMLADQIQAIFDRAVTGKKTLNLSVPSIAGSDKVGKL